MIRFFLKLKKMAIRSNLKKKLLLSTFFKKFSVYKTANLANSGLIYKFRDTFL